MMAKDRDQRHASWAELIADIEKILKEGGLEIADDAAEAAPEDHEQA